MANRFSKKPIKMWIDGTCFIINNFDKAKAMKSNLLEVELSSDGTLPDYLRDHNFVLSNNNESFTTSFQLPSDYYAHLSTFRDLSIRKLEKDTSTIITVPQNEGNITISGTSELNVVIARSWLHSIIGEIRSRQSATQFISIPVNSEEIQRNFQQFKDDILSGNPIEGVDESIFQSPLKLHITVAVFALMSSLEKDEAIRALNACRTEVIDTFICEGKPLKIQVHGIDCMNNNYSKVNILYANAKIVQGDNEDVLQKLVNSISDYFYNRGLIIQYMDNVKLHITLMNAKYRKPSAPSSPKHSKWYWKKQPFNATTILNKYKNYYFGEKTLDSVHISYMSSVGEDGFYKPLCIINF